MNIKTITTTDGVNTVDFGSAASRFYWFRNIGTTTVYVSGNSDISAGGDGDKFAHAQGNYFPKPVTDENGVYRYKFENGNISERSEEEMAADMPAPAPVPPTNEELAAAIAELAEVICSG